jgi:glycine/D-amino acid oxidase-like deaminating enzyme
MKSHARVVVIGGGVVGVGTLYALTKKGWTDVVLLERNELTSGSTWHAAGLLPLFNMSYSVGKVHQYSLDLYSKLEEETGQHVGLRQVSNIRLAQTKDRWDEFMYYAGIAETIGVQVNILTPEQVKEIWPLCNTDGLLGAIQHPNDGYVQPADLTQAMAKGARDKGAQIHRNTRVIAIEQKANDEWLVKTDKGDITCEHLVTATGNFVRQTGEMLGLDIPVIPVEHQYIVTEPHPEIQQRHKDGLPEMGVLRDADSSLVHARGKRAASFSARTSRARRYVISTALMQTMRSTSCSRKTWSALRRTSKAHSSACRPSARWASRKSTTAPSAIRPTARRSLALRMGQAQPLAQRGPLVWRDGGRRCRLAAGRVDRRG